MQTRIWQPVRAEAKIYGMALLGVICGLVGCLVVMMFFGFIWSVGGAIPGYFVGDFLSKSLHDGKAQRLIHWYFPRVSKTQLPSSSVKNFF